MDQERHRELYLSETGELLQLLNRNILGMEARIDGAVDEAFRAAHTIKGLAAAMGHEGAAGLAHALEDRLAQARTSAHIDAAFIDVLLAAADALAAAIAAGSPSDVRSVPGPVLLPVLAAHAPTAADVPGDTVLMARVRIDPDSPLPAARAALIRSNADRAGGVLGAWPAAGIDTTELLLFLGAAANQERILRAVLRAGARDVRFEPPPAAAPARTRVESRTGFVRVDRERLDALAEGVAELSVLHERGRLAGEKAGRDGWQTDRVGSLLAELRRTVIDMRMVPVSAAFDRFGRLIRDAARTAGKDIDFSIEGSDIQLDQAILDAVVDPLVHLLRNAVDHGIEPAAERTAAGKDARGRIRLSAVRDRNSVRIIVRDDGRGIARDDVTDRARAEGIDVATNSAAEDDLLRLLAQPGFSTASTVTSLSGRGIGLDVVVNRVRSLGGAIDLETTPGVGTAFTLRLPLTLALAHALRVRVGGEDYAIPLTHVSEAVALDPEHVLQQDGGREFVRVRGQPIPLIRLGRVFRIGAGRESAAVVAEAGDRRVALGVDELLGHEQIVVKSFDPPVGALPVFSGATLLADGRPALLIDPLSVV